MNDGVEFWLSWAENVLGAAVARGAAFLHGFKAVVVSLDDTGFFIAVAVVVTAFVVILLTLAWQHGKLTKAREELKLLGLQLSKVTEELSEERVWRLAGTQNKELPEDTLKKLYHLIDVNRAAG